MCPISRNGWSDLRVSEVWGVDLHQALRSVGELPHEPARFVVTDRQVGQLEAAPASLALSERQVARAAPDLPHAGMAEQMRVHRRRLAGRTMLGGTQRQDANVSSLGGLLDDEPGLAALKWPAGAGGAAFAGEEQRLVVGQALLLCPQQKPPPPPELRTRE